MQAPVLTEPGVRYYLAGTMKECRLFKDRYLSVIFNISMLLCFGVIVCGFLVYRYKGKLTPEEQAQKACRKKEYIFTKLQHLAQQRQKVSQDSITNLPAW